MSISLNFFNKHIIIKRDMKTGRIDCQCGDQIISNSGKTMHKFLNMAVCWNPECSRVYDYDTLEKARIENQVVVFIPPGKNLKVFKMNECDWWMDKNLEEAKKNYPKFVGIPSKHSLDNPTELTTEDLKNLRYHDVENEVKCLFIEELQRRQSITDQPEFFASTEY